MHAVHTGLVHYLELGVYAFPAALGHAVPVTITEARPVETAHFPFAELIGHAADVSREVVGGSLVVILIVVMHARLVARRHGAAPFRANGAVNVLAHLALEAVFPTLFGSDAHVPERVFMNGKEAAFKARVVSDVRNVPSEAGAIEQNVVARDVREFLEPVRIEIAKVRLVIHVRFVENFKVGVRMVAVCFDEFRPHFPPIVHVFGARRLRRAPVAHSHSTMFKSSIQSTRIHVKSFKNGRFVHRHAHAVCTKHFLELPDNTVGNGISRFMIVGKA